MDLTSLLHTPDTRAHAGTITITAAQASGITIGVAHMIPFLVGFGWMHHGPILQRVDVPACNLLLVPETWNQTLC